MTDISPRHQDNPADSDIAAATRILDAAENAAATEIAALREHLAGTGELTDVAAVLTRLESIERVMAGQRQDLADAATIRSFREDFSVAISPRPRTRHLHPVK